MGGTPGPASPRVTCASHADAATVLRGLRAHPRRMQALEELGAPPMELPPLGGELPRGRPCLAM
eukprot:1370997-Pyramimonas_sp.AAC.1